MPSEKVLEQKKQAVAELKEKLSSSVTAVLVDYKGITVADDTKLRKELREAGIEYSVTKNSLLKFAVNDLGMNELEGVLEGTTALALSKEDHVAAARILNRYADASKGKFTVKAGILDGKVIDANAVKELANLPPKEVLIAKVLGGFNAPISGFVYVLNANLSGLARVLDQIAKQQGA